MNDILKFIHAADLHLDQPFAGVSNPPNHIRSALVNAAYDAAEKIFDRAISERVDFVILSGDVADIDRCGPRGISFLSDQFQRLNESNIHVYWLVVKRTSWSDGRQWFQRRLMFIFLHRRLSKKFITVVVAVS